MATIKNKLTKEQLIDRFTTRQEILTNATLELKKHFIGIDTEIDTVISNLKTWYIFPEIINRPTTICLFGPTGVGKTDLIRRLVKILNFQDRYCEVEISNKGGSSWHKSIGSVLSQNANIVSGEPAIILLDEIQNFRTLDEEGNDIHDYDMKDVWTLLSDGKLPYKVEIDNLMSMLWTYNKKEAKAKTKTKTVVKSKKEIEIDDYEDDCEEDFENDATVNKNSYYSLNYFKTVLRLDDSIEEIALWSDEKKKSEIIKRLLDKTIYEEEDYTKTLIFISGNIDEAYGFTTNAKEVDIEADILHNKSKSVSILNIKEALGKRFRPEQISRMGNCHVIYPTLSRKSFEEIIQRKINAIIVRVKDQTEIELVIDNSINSLIYNNGVFPTQGTRPVFSTISEILESIIPEFLLNVLVDGDNKLEISYSNDNIVAKSSKKIQMSKYVGSLDTLKNKRNKNLNRKTLVAVHEAGHALVYAVLFKMTPNQIVATPVSDEMEGFVYSQENCHTKEMLRNRICVLLAGKEAEIIVFGAENQTSGCGDDLKKATIQASGIIRRWGMSDFYSHVGHSDRCPDSNNNVSQTNSIIEKIITDLSIEAKKIIDENKNLFLNIADNLIQSDKIEPKKFQEICNNHGLLIDSSVSSEDILYYDFSSNFEEFKNRR